MAKVLSTLGLLLNNMPKLFIGIIQIRGKRRDWQTKIDSMVSEMGIKKFL